MLLLQRELAVVVMFVRGLLKSEMIMMMERAKARYIYKKIVP